MNLKSIKKFSNDDMSIEIEDTVVIFKLKSDMFNLMTDLNKSEHYMNNFYRRTHIGYHWRHNQQNISNKQLFLLDHIDTSARNLCFFPGKVFGIRRTNF